MAVQVCSKLKHGTEGQDRDWGVNLGSAASHSPIGNTLCVIKPFIYNVLLGSIWEAERVISRERKKCCIFQCLLNFLGFPELC